jgi:lysyl-tRNA synthetase class 2
LALKAFTLVLVTQGNDTVAQRRTRKRWVPLVAGLITALLGARDIALVVRPHLWERVRLVDWILPGGATDVDAVRGVAAGALLVAGALLILLAHALRRRKRRAWRAVLVLLVVTILLHLVHRNFAYPAIANAVLLIALIAYRDQFFAHGDPRTRWRAFGAFFGLGFASVVIGMTIIEARPRGIVGHPSLGEVFRHVVLGLVGIPGPLAFTSERIDDFVTATLLALGALTVFTTAYLFLRPAEPPAILDGSTEEQMRGLLAAQGHRDSLGYFALRRDKSVLFSPTGKACIAYRVVSGVMLASGDPLGDPEAWPGAIDAFMEEAERHAWVPAVLGCSELGGEVWTRRGDLTALEIGDEAVVDVPEFTLDGRSMRNVRQMVNRVARAGYEATIRRVSELRADELAAFQAQAASWRGAETERGFSMALGRLGDAADGDCVIVTAEQDGRLRAFLHFVPWGDDGLSLDLMRRDRDAEAGLNEFLITSLLRQCPDLGIKRVSLNFAVFRSALERGERLGAGPVIRAWRGLLIFASRWMQIESLYRFNTKFQPDWVPRYVVYPGARDLPRIAIAALEAEAFIVWPHPGVRRIRRLLHLRTSA